MKLILVVALNQEQFQSYAIDRICNANEKAKFTPGRLETPHATYVFMKDKLSFKGINGCEVQFWGTWYDRPDHKAMKDAAMEQAKCPF